MENELRHWNDYGAIIARYADPEITEAFEELDRRENEGSTNS